MRAVATLAASIISITGLSALPVTPAAAKTCPNKAVKKVEATENLPAYTHERGCIHSFDGTPIVYNLYEPLNPAPRSLYAILEGPGWSAPGATSPNGQPPLTAGGTFSLIAAGYAYLTWDPRGFGQSGGVSEVDLPAAEGRDVSALIDKVLTGRPEIAVNLGTGLAPPASSKKKKPSAKKKTKPCSKKKRGPRGKKKCKPRRKQTRRRAAKSPRTAAVPSQPVYFNDTPAHNTVGEPVIGMIGGSYGGSLQFATVPFDPRIKAMVAATAWNDANYTFWPNNVIKLVWTPVLYALGVANGTAGHVSTDPSGSDGGVATGGVDPAMHAGMSKALALGFPDAETRAWFGQRSPSVFGAGRSGRVPEIPALLLQGTVDTLLNLNAAWANVVQMKKRNPRVPAKLVAYCGGHVPCPYSDKATKASPLFPGKSAAEVQSQQTLAWLDHHLRGDGRKQDQMPADVVYQTQSGDWFGLPTFPTPDKPGPATIAKAALSGTLVSHGVPTGVAPGTFSAVFSDGATSSSDPGQVTVPVFTAPAGHAVHVVGRGRVKATVTVNGDATQLFFRLIDKATGGVVDLQTEPLRVDNLDLPNNGTDAGLPRPHEITVDLVGVAYELPAGDTLELQVSTSTDSFFPNRGRALVTIADGEVSVPVLTSSR